MKDKAPKVLKFKKKNHKLREVQAERVS